jgi:3-dehydroquinate dehydratase II
VSASSVIWVLNGPNLNLLGQREPEIYGRATLADIEANMREQAKALGLMIEFHQSNHEGKLIDWLHEAKDAKAVILNPGAFTHSSIALYDAIKAISAPVIEVHLSNPHAREPFRKTSFVSPVARGVIQGFGAQGYMMALEAAAQF